MRINARVDYAIRAVVELAAVAPNSMTADAIATASANAGYPARVAG